MKWLGRVTLLLIASYATFFATVLAAMHQPPERFGQFMSHVPQALVWAGLPAARMWLWAREGHLEEGDAAPDFTLFTHNHQNHVTLSSHRGHRPVVLVFGSYT
jgi:L-ascorbate metabolism protein UlaG (beta-lactamase superfamily)